MIPALDSMEEADTGLDRVVVEGSVTSATASFTSFRAGSVESDAEMMLIPVR